MIEFHLVTFSTGAGDVTLKSVLVSIASLTISYVRLTIAYVRLTISYVFFPQTEYSIERWTFWNEKFKSEENI